MDDKNQNPETSGSACGCSDDPTAQSLNCPPVPDKALVLACIDPRMQEPVYKYLNDGLGSLAGNYSQVTIAGGAIGVVAPKFKAWSQTFWDNLSISLELHSIHRVIAINHVDCGAARAAYGYFEHPSERDPSERKHPSEGETQLHKVVMAEFRKQLTERHPQLKVETLLMDLKGQVKHLR